MALGLLGLLGPWTIAILLLVIFLVLGPKRIMKIGEGWGEAVKTMGRDGDEPPTEAPPAPAPPRKKGLAYRIGRRLGRRKARKAAR